MMDVDKAFMKELGMRIAAARRSLGLNQTEVAELLGCSQSTMATYELGTRRVPVAFLPKLADLFEMTVDELLNHQANGTKKPGKRGPPSKVQKQLELIERLPRAKQRFITEMLESYLNEHAA